MKSIKNIIVALLYIGTTTLLYSCSGGTATANHKQENNVGDSISIQKSDSIVENTSPKASIKQMTKDELLTKLKLKADSAKTYASDHKLNTDYSILIDFSIHSGKERFFVWDHTTNTVAISSLTCHGKGGKSTQDVPEFSNVESTNTSSKGHFRVGARAPSQHGIGIHYKMHGLETWNDKAFKRSIVLHSYDSVPPMEVYPEYIRFSSGCPAVSDKKMKHIDSLLQKQKTPLLMWIYM